MKIRFFSVLVFIVLFTLSPAQAFAAEWYVATTGTAGGSGAISSPWDLQTALNHPASVQPGDTIWLRGGTYSGIFTSSLVGTSGSPIVVRQYSGERAILDGGSTQATGVLSVSGSYTHYWGFEITLSDTDRVSAQAGSDPTDIVTTSGVYSISGTGNKFINLIIHDARGGYGYWAGVTDGEIYGNIIYHNGWDGPDRGHGHGIYTQNSSNTVRLIKDNISFNQFSSGIKPWGVNGLVNDYTIEGNIMFNNGILSSTTGFAFNLLFGTDAIGNIAENPIIRNNYTYYTTTSPDGENRIGDVAGCDSPTITDNYFAHGGADNVLNMNCTNVTMTGNTYYGVTTGFTTSSFPNNTYATVRPSDTKIFVRPNTYESGRAHIVIYNWNSKPNIDVDVSSVLSNNQAYSVYDVENYFGTPVATGTYTGNNITIPMTGTTVSAPTGTATPAHTPQEFGVFVLIGGNISSASPTPTPSPGSATTSDSDSNEVTTGTSTTNSSVTTTHGSTVSSSAPTVKLTQTATGNTSISSDEFIESNQLQFSGEAPKNALISITLTDANGKKTPGITKVDGNGEWSWSPPPNLKSGDYTATFLVQDKQGNTGSTTLKFTISEDGLATVTESVQESSGGGC